MSLTVFLSVYLSHSMSLSISLSLYFSPSCNHLSLPVCLPLSSSLYFLHSVSLSFFHFLSLYLSFISCPSQLIYLCYLSIGTSVNNVMCHGIPNKRVLEEGDILSVDISVGFISLIEINTYQVFYLSPTNINSNVALYFSQK